MIGKKDILYIASRMDTRFKEISDAIDRLAEAIENEGKTNR